MSRYYYDLHIHSCLSPCGDNDSTPNNIVGMGVLNGLQIMALTDHNSCKNCPAFFEAAKRQGIIPIPGMELTTAEDIHLVCLFEDLESALKFDNLIQTRLIRIYNRPDIFGDQLVMNGMDEVIDSEKYLLSNATNISLDEASLLVNEYGGICYPAHIDREANGIISILGMMPQDTHYPTVELHDGSKEEKYRSEHGLENTRVVVSSDAHCLWDISEAEHWIEIPDEPYSSALVRKNLIGILRRGL